MESDLRDKIRELALLRHAMPVLHRQYLPLLSRGSLLVYARKDAEDVVIVAINMDNSAQTFSICVDSMIPEGALLQDQISDKQVVVEAGNPRPDTPKNERCNSG